MSDVGDDGVMTAPDRRAQIAAGLADVRQRIDLARLAAGRVDPVGLTVVTKTFPAADVRILADLGVIDVAENRDQEARAKAEECADRGLSWHMIGQLQRNKAASVAQWADVVESVDRPELAVALSRAAESTGRTIEILVQVCLDPVFRPGRGGVDPVQVLDLAAQVVSLPSLTLCGVMGVAPFPGDPDDAFARLERLARAVAALWPDANRLSAGMSSDLEQAIAHGATHVRVGGAVLGQRSAVQ